MKILINTQCFAPRTGGVENLMTGLADGLTFLGHEILVRADGPADIRDPGRNYKIVRYRAPKLIRSYQRRRDLQKDTQFGHFDAAFCDSWKSAERMEKSAVTVACLAHGSEFLAAARDFRRARRIQKALRAVNMIIANSYDTAARVRHICPELPPIHVINPPTDPIPSPDISAQRWIEGLIGGRHPLVVTLCRLEARKGVDHLIAATAQLKQDFPDILLLIAGHGPDGDRLKMIADRSDLLNHCIFLDKITDSQKSALFAYADLFAMPSRPEESSIEGFGMVYREAAQFGLACLAGYGGGTDEAVINERTGMHCDGKNLSDIVNKMWNLLRNDAWRKALGREGKKITSKNLWPHAAGKYVNLLSKRTL